MDNNKFVSEKHVKARGTFRLFGPLLILVGAGCMLVAFIDFFTLGPFEEPTLFWLFFLAMPFLFIGVVLSNLGYGGTVAKYQSREYAPVVKDTFNYLAKETKSGVKEVANAIQSGGTNSSITCRICDHDNPTNANFCNGCGEKLAQRCKKCDQINVSGARFCNHCGGTL
ncbi:hypothetical protein DS745_02855 [Anaerobacillus alkaliphilus]|uniref:DZANK-type domain-containing protein n=1 Tax=Anaerobacillus alkaliphilus TaxID=1548597 RepID=A0A4Q0W110_9BACI|nr:zinc ribbon domain-containing protein [Anaerobacillus alkaliphilus]RXJ04341.1 hypothetical protein DS745_02855 [Anaerobacillus alkaliphilus]